MHDARRKSLGNQVLFTVTAACRRAANPVVRVCVGALAAASCTAGEVPVPSAVVCQGSACPAKLASGEAPRGSQPWLVDLARTERHACAITYDNHVACWGDNTWGQLGDGTRNAHSTPQPVPGLAQVVRIAVGGRRSCAVDVGGHAWCWGESHFAAAVTSPYQTTPVRLDSLGLVRDIAVDLEDTYFISQQGHLYFQGPLGDAAIEKPMELPGYTHVARIQGSDEGIGCVQFEDGSLACNGLAPRLEMATPIAGKFLDFRWSVDRVTRTTRVIALRDDGTVLSKTWDRTVCSCGCAQDNCTAEPIAGIPPSKSINDDCALGMDGVLRCWSRAPGMVQDGQFAELAAPVEVPALAGAERLLPGPCAVAADGTLRCWGDAAWGADGTGSPGNQEIAKDIKNLSDAVVVTAVDWTTCALRKTGAVVCFGQTPTPVPFGQKPSVFQTPAAVPGMPLSERLWLGTDGLCARAPDQQIFCVGRDFIDASVATTAQAKDLGPLDSLTLARNAVAGQFSAVSCLRIASGRLWCWSLYTQSTMLFGAPVDADSYWPGYQAPGVGPVSKVAIFEGQGCAIAVGGQLWCWG